jgi:ribosomal-protein-alanine N-acetyltransferase
VIFDRSAAARMPGPRLREARPADFARLLAIDHICFPPGIAYSAAELRQGMTGRHAFTVIAEIPVIGSDSESEIAGFVVGRPAAGRVGHIITIDVLPQFQRQGIGTTLMSDAERRFKSLDLHSITLETAVNNLAALRFYHQLGFRVVRPLRGYYAEGLDGLLLEKRI